MRLSRIITLGSVLGLSSLSLAGCSLPFLGQKPATSTEPQNQVDQMANAAELSVMMSTGQAGTCVITNTEDQTQDSMQLAIKGKKFLMKGTNFSVSAKQPDQKTQKIGYMLNDSEYTYIWEDQATTGMKMKEIEPASQQSPETQAETQDLGPAPRTADTNPLNTFEANPKYRIECQIGDVPDEAFMPPATVNFMDLSQGRTNPGLTNPAVMPQTLPQDTNEPGQ